MNSIIFRSDEEHIEEACLNFERIVCVKKGYHACDFEGECKMEYLVDAPLVNIREWIEAAKQTGLISYALINHEESHE